MNIYNHPNHNFLTSFDTRFKKYIEAISSDYLSEGDYWVYAVQPAQLDSGGLTSNSIQIFDVFMNKDYFLGFLRYADGNYQNIIELEIGNLRFDIEKSKNLLKIIQKRNYFLKIGQVEGLQAKEYKINILNPMSGLVDHNLTHELYLDLEAIQQGKDIIKPWH